MGTPVALAGSIRSRGLRGFLGPLEPHLDAVEEDLRRQLDAFAPELRPMVRATLEAGGKRLRPALALLAGEVTGGVDDRHVRLGTILEMVHTATLVHDDILDHAELRRQGPTATSRWGPELAVLLGDALFAHALQLAAAYPTPHVCAEIARATNTVCSGEILQTLRRQDLSLAIPEYIRLIEMKTAALFEVSCRLGAFFNCGDAAATAALARYGRDLGIAYQIYDDCLDIYGRESEAGKSLGTDVATGKLTLPVLLALDAGDRTDDCRELEALLAAGPAADARRLRALLARHQAFERGLEVLDRYLAGAAAHLAELPDGPARRALAALPRTIGGRAARLRRGPDAPAEGV